ncbi:MAG TPA: FAD/NAD(P)-binding protein [Methyloceanibacter sp.]|nr:FAD/NAD(P)-binding protein [Methyloceanibacter sp.]
MKLEGGEMRKAPLTVSVVGGGFTGAAASIACLARIDRPFRIVVVEPSASLGRGVAYGAHHPLHSCAPAIFRFAPASPAIF